MGEERETRGVAKEQEGPILQGWLHLLGGEPFKLHVNVCASFKGQFGNGNVYCQKNKFSTCYATLFFSVPCS